MADNFTANPGAGGAVFAADEVGPALVPRVKLQWGVDGVAVDASASNPLPVAITWSGFTGLTDAQLRAAPVPVNGTVSVGNFPTGFLSAQSGAWNVGITGTVSVTGTFWQATQPVSGPLTDAELRANPVPVSVTFPVTQPVSAASLPLPTGAASEATLAAMNAKVPSVGQATMAASQPVVIASNQSALPMIKIDAESSGTITAINGNVAVSCQGKGTVTLQVEGTYTATGGFTPQARVNPSGAWVTLSGASTLLSNAGAYSATIASAAQGIYQVDVSGFAEFRIVALGAVTGTATISMRATDAVAMTALDQSLPAGSALIGGINAAQINGVAPLMGPGNTGTGSLRVTLATDQPSNTNPRLVGTQTPSMAVASSAASTNLTTVKASAGRVFQITVANYGASAAHLKIYNKASNPVLASDVPRMTYTLPATTGLLNLQFGALGEQFGLGIALAITRNLADNDATAIGANEVRYSMSFL